MNEFECPYCSKPIAISQFLTAVTGYDRNTRSSGALCPQCRKTINFQIRTNLLVVGYIYSSGSSHFEGLFDVPTQGIRCIVADDGVTYRFQGQNYPGSREPDAGK